MKCAICKKRIETTFLGKIKGVYVKDKKGKVHVICNDCQKRFKTKEDILKQLGL